jgi:hypothetical protein
MLDRGPSNVVLTPRTAGGLDAYRNATLVDGDPVTTTGTLTLAGDTEDTIGKERTIVTGTLVLAPSVTAVSRLDAVSIDGAPYEITGEPVLLRSPRTQAPHHWEIPVRSLAT